MKEKPIIFSAESVKQILAGAKTQTRRVIKPQLDGWEPYKQPEWCTASAIDKDGMLVPGKEVFGVYSEDGECSCVCPFGAPGDRLWVREAFLIEECTKCSSGLGWLGGDCECSPVYRADHPDTTAKWKSPLFLPRRHSRLTLEITNVRCEQLKDMKNADVMAEGYINAAQFVRAWNSLNGKRGFAWRDGSVWVWVLEFKKVEIGIAYVYQTDVGKETALANAKVIAAAPEMYDALTALCKKADTTGNLDSHWDEILSNAKAVLAKAKGETT